MTADATLRDHIGWVWYEKMHIVPERDVGMRHFLRFSSVNYYGTVYLNGQELISHVGGHLPFEVEVTDRLLYGSANKITVAVNNTLSWSTIPQGDFNYYNLQPKVIGNWTLTRAPEGAFTDIGNFDFFNYAGILRSVYIIKVPKKHIKDIHIMAEHRGSFIYEVSTGDVDEIEFRILDDDENEVYSGSGAEGKGQVDGVRPWWPRGMGNPSLYVFEAKLIVNSQVVDIYREVFGFRTVTWSQDKIFINDRPFYCIGFGMHEDFEIHGRGFDRAVMTKDLNLLEWMGGNCYRTTHYPYDEERMRENDRRGIAIIAETPAVGLKGFPKANNLLHIKMLEDLVSRDKNHPSIIMWSLANEPHTEKKESRNYFKALVDTAHALDPTRPVTTVYGPTNSGNDQTADLLDIICVNRYYGWYINMGSLDWVNSSLIYDIAQWKEIFRKPIIITEYGADSISGLNQEPSIDFSEQYQNEIIMKTHEAFDVLRQQNILAGEMIWNFADFMTGMSTTRAVGNHKGVFTRNRQAKMAAYTLRKRYLGLLDQTEHARQYTTHRYRYHYHYHH
ncbi:hypothetical protein WR25_19121 [Diploscapter pachys]|uniref:Beta-glucuronidase n=1 Tax=Diploscapter pachys TaxID=2018661 RepID=A0A2A2L346_9BILA|nr:hypothetical protein WR25_19121 [Diploscapter pachys]